MKTKDNQPIELATTAGLSPAEFPIGSPRSRAAARQLAEERDSLARASGKYITVKVSNLERAKTLARLFSSRGGQGDLGPVRLIDGETGREIPY
jgi:hypothetical protein